jgi:hypothetical protein
MKAVQKSISVDLSFENHQSLFLVRGVTPAGVAWLESHISQEGYQPYWPHTVVAEPRYVESLLQHAIADGMEVA